MSLFSIVIPSYNRPDLLERLLNSIRQQTIHDYEVFVVDDASLDSKAYACTMGHFSRDISLHYFRNEENRGAQYSRNRGVAASTGEFVAFVDDDDEWLPDKLERQSSLFASASERLGLVYAWADTVGEDGVVLHQYRSVHSGNALAAILDTCFVPSPTVVVRRAVLDDVGVFDDSLPSCQDWDMWTRVVEAGYDIDVVEEVLALHHKHNRASIGTSRRSLEGFLRFFAKHTDLYKRMGMTRDLSEKYRWLAYQANQMNDRELAGMALRCSLSLWKGNLKAWVRYVQFLIGKAKS